MICSCSQQTNQTKLDHLSILKISLRPPGSEIATENTMQIKKGSTHSWPRVTKPRIIHAHLNDPNVLWQLTACIGPLDKGKKSVKFSTGQNLTIPMTKVSPNQVLMFQDNHQPEQH